jgi:hypothetical protein
LEVGFAQEYVPDFGYARAAVERRLETPVSKPAVIKNVEFTAVTFQQSCKERVAPPAVCASAAVSIKEVVNAEETQGFGFVTAYNWGFSGLGHHSGRLLVYRAFRVRLVSWGFLCDSWGFFSYCGQRLNRG